MSEHENIIKRLSLKIVTLKGILNKIYQRNDYDIEKLTTNEIKRCVLIITQIKTNKHQIVEYLRLDNEELLKKSNSLLKKTNKMIKDGNRSCAKLIFNRIEEIDSKRQEINREIISLSAD